ncbi:FAD-dependent oxidoreductase [Herbaspirillum sp. C7C8]|uniref:FAD-dependent oxidoreductase n=1 Tax=Herbaspirillum sp. C7C8 TaxID=2736665 RepID=UPI001F525863|nr:FAD-dependent oxidoreductase [Herbaspirillum sp. C7C8]
MLRTACGKVEQGRFSLIRYLSDCEAASLQDYPVCVVGSGPGGLSLAVALARQGQRVLLVDGGDWRDDQIDDDAYQGAASAPHPGTTEYRRQRFGGTTHLWGGRCVPLDPADFAARSHVPLSGWPISYEEYARYLPEAMQYCDAGNADFTPASLAGGNAPMFSELPQLSQALTEYIERYSLPTDFAAKFSEELKASGLVNVVLRARCTRLLANTDGSRIDAVVLHDGQQEVQVRASQIVLAGGAIEATRLLLCTREQVPAWQRFDGSLGRYYACHFDLIFGEMRLKGEKPRFRFQKTQDGVYARRKLQFTPQWQNQLGLLNSTLRLHFPSYADPGHGSGVLSAIYLAKSILPSEHQDILNHGNQNAVAHPRRLAHVRNVMLDAGSVFGFAYDMVFKRKLAKRKLPYTLIPNRNGTYPLEFNSEQVSDAANRISLLDTTDRYGMRRVDVQWRLTSQDIDSGVQSFMSMQSLLAGTRHCRLDFDPGELKEQVTRALPVGGHHIGSTRMGRFVEDSVVDTDCRVHGVSNLLVLSSSVFPTNGHANPTLSIVALALRMADHLQTVLR